MFYIGHGLKLLRDFCSCLPGSLQQTVYCMQVSAQSCQETDPAALQMKAPAFLGMFSVAIVIFDFSCDRKDRYYKGIRIAYKYLGQL